MDKSDKLTGRKILEATGWTIINTQDYRRTSPGLKGFPDLICIKSNVVCILEEKVKGDYFTEAEIELEKKIKWEEGPNFFYLLATQLEDYELLSQYWEGAGEIPGMSRDLKNWKAEACPDCNQPILTRLRARHLKSNHKLSIIGDTDEKKEN